MTQQIGIVACSAEGAALCYRTIVHEGAGILGAHTHPPVCMHTPSLSDYMEYIDANDWAGVGGVMLDSAERLAEVGADFLICPDNTIHQALPYIESRLPLPWLHIADVVADEALARGFRRPALMGTHWLMESEVYGPRLADRGLQHAIPEAAARREMGRIIMDELVNGKFLPASVAWFIEQIGVLQKAGCDAVILGCTEIPLIVGDSNSPLPVLDSTRLLARAAVQRAVAPTAG